MKIVWHKHNDFFPGWFRPTMISNHMRFLMNIYREGDPLWENNFNYSETSEQRTPTGLKKIVRYREVSAIGR